MRNVVVVLLTLISLSGCEKPADPVPIRSDWGIGIRITEPIQVCYYVEPYDYETSENCYKAEHSNGTKFGIYVPIGYRAVDDTITPEFFSAYMDTVFLYTIVESDTLYYRSKDLTDLESYDLQPVGVLESGTQYFNFMVDVSSSDFY
jgi:hypothetical protein